MDIACDPLQNPCLRISVIGFDMQSGIELEQKLFVLVLFISDKWQQTHLLEAIQCFFQTRQTSNSFNLKALVRKDTALVV